MRIPSIALFALAAAALPALAGMAVESGALLMRGGTLQTDSLRVAGSLEGHGTIDSPSSRIEGILAPSGEYPEETGTLHFAGDLEFAGTYECTVNGHEDLDLVQAVGPISGTAEIQVDKAPAAIPLDQPILAGAADGDLAAFSIAPAQADAFRLSAPAPGSLALTDLVGDTDADGLPDYWEFAHYSSRILAVPGDDDDGDRSINLYEFGAGTDPWDDQSVFAILRTESHNGNAVVWSSVPCKSYAVRAAASPDGPYDQLLASNLVAAAAQLAWTNAQPFATFPFCRVVVEP